MGSFATGATITVFLPIYVVRNSSAQVMGHAAMLPSLPNMSGGGQTAL